LLPGEPVRPPVLDLVLAQRAVHVVLGRRALGAQPPARDRAVRVALDLDDLLVLDVDLLAAADGAIGADGVDDAVSGRRARRQPLRPLRLRRAAEPQRVVAKLAKERHAHSARVPAAGYA